MTIKAFIEQYNNGEIKDLKTALEVKDYVPFADKYDLCASVLSECNTIDEKTGIVSIDSVMRHVVFTITILSLYTNLEFSSGAEGEISSIDEYDMLCQYKLLKPIINLFEDEYAECENMMDIMQHDLVANSNDIYHVVANVAKQLLDVVEPLADVLKHKVEDFNLDLSQDNIDKYAKIFETLGAKK